MKIDRNHFVRSQWVDAFEMIIKFLNFYKNFIISNAFILWVQNNIKSLIMTYITYYINSKYNIEVIVVTFKWHKIDFYIIFAIYIVSKYKSKIKSWYCCELREWMHLRW